MLSLPRRDRRRYVSFLIHEHDAALLYADEEAAALRAARKEEEERDEAMRIREARWPSAAHA